MVDRRANQRVHSADTSDDSNFADKKKVQWDDTKKYGQLASASQAEGES